MRVARIQRVSNRMTPVTGRVARLPDLAERKCYPRTMTSEEGSTQPPTLTENDLVFIREAARFFEDPGLIVKGMNLIGQPLETFQKKLPRKVQTAIAKASRKAIEQALVLSTKTIPSAPTAANSFEEATASAKWSGYAHTGAAAAIGGAGGILGIATLPLELPVSTLVMLRSIADIARQYGHDLNSAETKLECIYVFSMGSPGDKDDEMESAYYSSRLAFAGLLREASAAIANLSAQTLTEMIANNSAPALIRLIAAVAAQFEIRVTKKLLAQATPIIGAIGGAGLNAAFASYFQECARYHFGLKRLERERGYDVTRVAFEAARGKAGSP